VQFWPVRIEAMAPEAEPELDQFRHLAEASNTAIELVVVRERLEAVGSTIIPPKCCTREYLAKKSSRRTREVEGSLKAGGLNVD